MDRLFSVFGPTIALFAVLYIVAELSRWWGKLHGVVSEAKEVAMLMEVDRGGWRGFLRTWIRSK